MTGLVRQPQGGTIRKVQASANVVLIAVPVAGIFSPMIVQNVEWLAPNTVQDVRLALEIGLTSLLTWGASWGAGYMTKARDGEIGK